MTLRLLFALAAFGPLAACASRIKPITGVRVTRPLPARSLPSGHHQVVFSWDLQEQDMQTRGDGAMRLASPDTARLDFFLAGGLGSGAALLIRNELRLPDGVDPIAKKLFLPTPMLWALLGRVAVPPIRDTAVYLDGDTLRAELGNPVAWRVTFVRDSLRRLERIENRKVVEWVSRSADGRIRYRTAGGKRQLDVKVTNVLNARFDASVWSLQ